MGWSGAFCVAVSVLGLAFGVSFEDEDCAARDAGAALKIAASGAISKIERRCGMARFTVVRFSLV
jgi:hypothetical protein